MALNEKREALCLELGDRSNLAYCYSRRREGRYLLRTNLCKRDPVELWSFYIQLVEIEALFKSLKDDLCLRPHLPSARGSHRSPYLSRCATQSARDGSGPVCFCYSFPVEELILLLSQFSNALTYDFFRFVSGSATASACANRTST